MVLENEWPCIMQVTAFHSLNLILGVLLLYYFHFKTEGTEFWETEEQFSSSSSHYVENNGAPAREELNLILQNLRPSKNRFFRVSDKQQIHRGCCGLQLSSTPICYKRRKYTKNGRLVITWIERTSRSIARRQGFYYVLSPCSLGPQHSDFHSTIFGMNIIV